MGVTLKTLAAVLVILFSTSAMAQEMAAPKGSIGRLMTPAETEYWLTMAVKYSRYEKPWHKRPKIEIVEEEVFLAEFCEGKPCTLLGVRFFATPDTVYVRSTANAFPGSRGGIIVHELTHWLAALNGLGDDKRTCADAAAKEVEAYAAGYLYERLVENKAYPFLVPDVYSECILYSMNNGPRIRGQH